MKTLVSILLLTLSLAASADTPPASVHLSPYANWVDGDTKQPIEQNLRDKGFTDTDFTKWAPFVVAHYKGFSGYCDDCYATSVDVLLGWKNSGLSPALASQLVDAGFDDTAMAIKVAPYFVKQCGSKIYDLDTVNPYSVTKKCFLIYGYSVIQLLDQHNALASKEHTVLLQFKTDAPPEGAAGELLVIGIGAYKYTSTTGALTIVSKMRVLVDFDADSGN